MNFRRGVVFQPCWRAETAKAPGIYYEFATHIGWFKGFIGWDLNQIPWIYDSPCLRAILCSHFRLLPPLPPQKNHCVPLVFRLPAIQSRWATSSLTFANPTLTAASRPLQWRLSDGKPSEETLRDAIMRKTKGAAQGQEWLSWVQGADEEFLPFLFKLAEWKQRDHGDRRVMKGCSQIWPSGTHRTCCAQRRRSSVAKFPLGWLRPGLLGRVWVNTYRYIFSGMNIHLPAILGFTRYQGFDPHPHNVTTVAGSTMQQPATATWVGLSSRSSGSLGSSCRWRVKFKRKDLQLFPLPEKVFNKIDLDRLSHCFQSIFSKFAVGLTWFKMPELRLPGHTFCVCFSTHPHFTTLDLPLQDPPTKNKPSCPWPTRIKASHGLAWPALPSALWWRGPDVEMGRTAPIVIFYGLGGLLWLLLRPMKLPQKLEDHSYLAEDFLGSLCSLSNDAEIWGKTLICAHTSKQSKN